MASLNIISEEFTDQTLVVRNRIENFISGSQLMVHESQEALFFKNGQALDLFGPGRHTLTTANMPLLGKIFGKIFGGNTPFPCEVYFINKVNVLDMPWGTPAPPMVVRDPEFGIPVKIRACGQTGVRVSDARRLLVKLVGQLSEFDVESVKRCIRGMMVSSIKESISQAFTEDRVSVLEITSHLSRLEEKIMAKVNAKVETFGISINSFAITAIEPDENDLSVLKQATNDSLKSRMHTKDKQFDMQQIGYSYQDKRKFDVLEEAAKNTGTAGGFMGLGMGLGMGAGVGREFGGMMNFGMSSQQKPQQAPAKACPSCGAPLAQDAKFCQGCGYKVQEEGKICPTCQNPVAADAKFCPHCGGKVESSTPKFCPNCGKPTQEGMRFCAECGCNLLNQ